MYREKILTMLPVLNNSETRIVEEMVNNAIRYCSTVTAIEAQLEILPYRCSPEELREEIARLNSIRNPRIRETLAKRTGENRSSRRSG